MIEFAAWPKIPRLASSFTITEKIDGTNAAIVIDPQPFGAGVASDPARISVVFAAELDEVGDPVGEFHIYAQSRNRLITPAADNFGFAGWVCSNAAALVDALGKGRHFGEWWGSGIQRGYGLTKGEKRFSLFNVNRYADLADSGIGLGLVPVLSRSVADASLTDQARLVDNALADLIRNGSSAAPGFPKPEGVVLFHSRSQESFKAFCDESEKDAERAERGAA